MIVRIVFLLVFSKILVAASLTADTCIENGETCEMITEYFGVCRDEKAVCVEGKCCSERSLESDALTVEPFVTKLTCSEFNGTNMTFVYCDDHRDRLVTINAAVDLNVGANCTQNSNCSTDGYLVCAKLNSTTGCIRNPWPKWYRDLWKCPDQMTSLLYEDPCINTTHDPTSGTCPSNSETTCYMGHCCPNHGVSDYYTKTPCDPTKQHGHTFAYCHPRLYKIVIVGMKRNFMRRGKPCTSISTCNQNQVCMSFEEEYSCVTIFDDKEEKNEFKPGFRNRLNVEFSFNNIAIAIVAVVLVSILIYKIRNTFFADEAR